MFLLSAKQGIDVCGINSSKAHIPIFTRQPALVLAPTGLNCHCLSRPASVHSSQMTAKPGESPYHVLPLYTPLITV